MASEVLAVLDASAVLAWVFNERGAATVEKLLPVSTISSVNLAEVCYRAIERGYRDSTSNLIGDLGALGLGVTPFEVEQAELVPAIRQAAKQAAAKHPELQGGLSLADCACIATGASLNLPVIGGDQLWEAIDFGRSVAVKAFR